MIGHTEWKDYFMLAPIDNLDDLLYHWRYATVNYLFPISTHNNFCWLVVIKGSLEKKNRETFTYKLYYLFEKKL